MRLRSHDDYIVLALSVLQMAVIGRKYLSPSARDDGALRASAMPSRAAGMTATRRARHHGGRRRPPEDYTARPSVSGDEQHVASASARRYAE